MVRLKVVLVSNAKARGGISIPYGAIKSLVLVSNAKA
jgi:hypothetical protein